MAEEHDEKLAKMEDKLVAQVEPKVEEEAQVVQEVEETTKSESVPDKTKPSEDEKPEPKEEAKPEEKEELSDEEVEKLSEKAQRRFKKLADKAKELDKLKANKALENLEVKDTPIDVELDTGTDRRTRFPWEKELPKPEITVEDYKAQVTTAATQAAQQEIRKEKILGFVSTDAALAENKYEELNPDSEVFDKELADYVYDTFRAKFDANNEYRLSEHVESTMSIRSRAMDRALESKQAEEAKLASEAKVSEQAANQAVTPSISDPVKKEGIKSKLSKVSTIEELEKLESELSV